MGQALYRKYRSKHLDEIVGQEHITQTLSNALKSGKISHAYLFTGPKGVGKTSIARILAHEVNGLPYDDERSHLDIIEIDAASNRRIDEIRELRERVHIAPTTAKYKVYIIDEVHMLTKEAFNALLKTLEEPPEHVIFILATTEAHKLPETIVSRTQRFTFKPIEPAQAVEHLKSIAKTEKLTISDEALALIAEHGDGSFRDSISLLDQVRNINTKVELEDVQQMLGLAPKEAILKLVTALSSLQPSAIIETLQELLDQGYQAGAIASQLLQVLRNGLVNNVSEVPIVGLLPLMQQLLEVGTHADPNIALEIALLGYVLNMPTDTPVAAPTPVQDIKPTLEAAQHTAPKPTPAAKQTALSEETWADFLKAVKQRHNTLYSVVRMAQPEFSGDTLILTFNFPFHQKRLSEAKNQQMLQDTIKDFTGTTLTLQYLVRSDALPQKEKPKTAAEAIDTISDIFGGAELMD